MRTDIETWCKECTICLERRAGPRVKLPLTPISMGGPFNQVGIDVLQMPKSGHQHQYVLVVIDYLTKWVEAYPLRDQTALTIARTLAYHLQTDSLTERFNWTLLDMTSKSIKKRANNWDLYLPFVLFSYRVAHQDCTQASPFSLLYGREAQLPTTLNQPEAPRSYVAPDGYLAEMEECMRTAWEAAQQAITKAQAHQKEQYDKQTEDLPFSEGDLVCLPG